MRLQKWYSFAAGSCDVLTGILLICAPLFTLKLMGISEMPAEPVFIRYIGVFVCSVGIFYWLPLLPNAGQGLVSFSAVWVQTAIVRLFVGLFVSYQVYTAGLVLQWSSVAVVDLSLALFQVLFLLPRMPRQ